MTEPNKIGFLEDIVGVNFGGEGYFLVHIIANGDGGTPLFQETAAFVYIPNTPALFTNPLPPVVKVANLDNTPITGPGYVHGTPLHKITKDDLAAKIVDLNGGPPNAAFSVSVDEQFSADRSVFDYYCYIKLGERHTSGVFKFWLFITAIGVVPNTANYSVNTLKPIKVGQESIHPGAPDGPEIINSVSGKTTVQGDNIIGPFMINAKTGAITGP